MIFKVAKIFQISPKEVAENFDIDDATEFLAFEGRDNAIDEWIMENQPKSKGKRKDSSNRMSKAEMIEKVKSINKND